MTRPTGGPNGRPKGQVKTHCIRGHARTPENVEWASGNCRPCRYELRRLRREGGGTQLEQRVREVKPKPIKPTLVKPKNRAAYERRSTLTIPSAPVFELLDRQGMTIKGFGPRYARLMGTKPDSGARQLWRAQESGRMTIHMADTVCIALGRHPAEVFGPEWFTYGLEVADAV